MKVPSGCDYFGIWMRPIKKEAGTCPLGCPGFFMPDGYMGMKCSLFVGGYIPKFSHFPFFDFLCKQIF